ncbi:RidA family protein [Altererythrobacter sp. MF3-039]|uniref:RidA family protein n=1 Tax=Altererythrobacter sp. MF3-039 TaxID=3252901 RepID=UPI00390C8AB6
MRTLTSTIALAAMALAATPVLAHEHGDDHSSKRAIMPENEQARAFQEQFGFSEATIHGDSVYLSGIIAGPVPEGMTDEQMYDAVFAYIGGVLERAGSSWDDVVDITTYHVDIEQSLPPLSAAKNKVVKAPFPAWTAIDIDRLYTPGGLVEIKVTAKLSAAEAK